MMTQAVVARLEMDADFRQRPTFGPSTFDGDRASFEGRLETLIVGATGPDRDELLDRINERFFKGAQVRVTIERV